MLIIEEMKTTNLPNNIADYDSSDCDYIKYWQTRQYEHEAEKMALSKLLPASGESMVDLGGGYGRLTPFYAPRFQEIRIVDTSEKHLKQAQVMFNSLGLKKVEVKKGDVCNLPFKSESQDTALMVRVMHHLRHPERVFAEIHRVLKPDGILVLEFPNKCHFRALIRNLLKVNLGFYFNIEPYEQPAAGEDGIFYNFHLRHIRHLLQETGFRIEKKLSVSNFRNPLLKRILPQNILLLMERIAQTLLTPLNFGPSIFLRCRKVYGHNILPSH